MNSTSRISAVLAYIPVLGWLFVFLVDRRDPLAMFHLKQSLGLFLSLAALTLGWAVLGWVLTWIPYLDVLAVALFALVLTAYLVGAVVWVMGVVNAAQAQLVELPLFGGWAERLHFG
jgi:uncharacterized membrane protein